MSIDRLSIAHVEAPAATEEALTIRLDYVTGTGPAVRVGLILPDGIDAHHMPEYIVEAAVEYGASHAGTSGWPDDVNATSATTLELTFHE